jgi:hypothetical protein
MPMNDKLIFCFYCGRFLKDYIIGEVNRCPFCGVELNYINNNLSKKIKKIN